MDNTPPKISFIPKGSLIREETFLERPRPRSAIGIVAVFVFIISAVGFAGLYFYNNSLNNQIVTKLGQIQDIQKVFGASPQVQKAKDFRSRAEIVQELLDGHTIVTPILDFLSANTLTDIMYDKFSFTKVNGAFTLDLNGEAPTYAALAYQREVLRGKTTELVSSSISNVSLTQFGTVSFSLELVFNPTFLSYTQSNTAQVASSTPSVAALPAISQTVPIPSVASAPTPQGGTVTAQATGTTPYFVSTTTGSSGGMGSSTSSSTNGQLGTSTSQTGSSVTGGSSSDGSVTVPIPVAAAPVAKPSFWSSVWSWFKFW